MRTPLGPTRWLSEGSKTTCKLSNILTMKRYSTLTRNRACLQRLLRSPSSHPFLLQGTARTLSQLPEVQNKKLPSHADNRRSRLARRFSDTMDHLQSHLFVAGQRLNDLTGYSGIESMKRDITAQGNLPFALASKDNLVYGASRAGGTKQSA